MKRFATFCCLALLLSACDEPSAETSPEEAPAPAAEAEPAPEVEAEPAPDPNEACARAVVVAWQGAPHAAETVTRSQEEAAARAAELLARVEGGESIEVVAREASDASSSGPRGGLLGTYERGDWPGAHEVLRDPVFGLAVGARTSVIEAPYGYAFAERCAVEKVHTRHILIRFEGARNAGEDITRTRDEARAAAEAVRERATAEGADFAALAREASEDSSADNGGDLGSIGRGRMAAAYEEAAFALGEGEVSAVVETEFGFHVIRRER